MDLQVENVIIRPATVEDMPLIWNSYLKAYRNTPTNSMLTDQVYFAHQKEILNRLICREGAVVSIACNKSDPDQIFAYMIGELAEDSATLHWVYCKSVYRNFKISSALIDTLVRPGEKLTYTHYMPAFEKLMRRRNVVYKPFWFYL
jgi:hypothetical protein